MNQFQHTYEDYLNAISFKSTDDLSIQDSLEDQNHHSLWTLGLIKSLESKKDAWGVLKSLEYTCKMLCFNDYITENLNSEQRQALIFMRDALYMTMIRTLNEVK